MRLIDADALESKIINVRDAVVSHDKYSIGYSNGMSMAHALSVMSPTIDAVLVVRCKDCIHGTAFGEDFNCRLYPEWYWFREDHFCADGERRKENV